MTVFETHIIRQIIWSRITFGPGPRSEGVLDHIEKEASEIRAEPGHAGKAREVERNAENHAREVWRKIDHLIWC